QQNADGRYDAGNRKRTQTEPQRLWHRPDEVDRFIADIRENRTRSEHEHQSNDRRRDEHRPADIARGRARFAGENRDVFESNQRGADQRHAPLVVRNPDKVGTEHVGNIRGRKDSPFRDDGQREQPNVPSNDESGEFVEAEFRPLINAAFERYPIAQINNDPGLRNVEEQNCEQPEEQVRLSELGGGSDPSRADDEQDLSENEIEKAERFPERLAAPFNVLLRALEIDTHCNLRSSILMITVRFFRR